MFLYNPTIISNLFDFEEVILYFSPYSEKISETAKKKSNFWKSFPTFVRSEMYETYRRIFNTPLNVPERIKLIEWMEIKNPLDRWEGLLSDLDTFAKDEEEEVHFPENYEIREAMYELMPQFFLRNIPRVERYEEEILPFNKEELLAYDAYEEIEEVKKIRYDRPFKFFLKEFGIDEIKRYREGTIKWFFKTTWYNYFSREIKETFRKSLWLYKPDQQDQT